MAIVLCVSAFFLAFAAAIVYTAGLLTAEANERLEQERCYQLAKSYAKVLDTELTSYTRKTEENSTTFYGFASRFWMADMQNMIPAIRTIRSFTTSRLPQVCRIRNMER